MFKTLQKLNLLTRWAETLTTTRLFFSHPHYYQKRGNESRHLVIMLGKESNEILLQSRTVKKNLAVTATIVFCSEMTLLHK